MSEKREKGEMGRKERARGRTKGEGKIGGKGINRETQTETEMEIMEEKRKEGGKKSC